MRALVVGGGVSGLTTAAVLLEANWEVTVVAREWAPNIVSSVAAAIWHPYQVSHPHAVRWGGATLRRLQALMDEPEAGVRAVAGREFHLEAQEPPDWSNTLPYYRPLPREQVPDKYACGFCFELPMIETPKYMRWLHAKVVALGAHLETRELATLDGVLGAWDAVVNCTGLGARGLVGDETMVPIRGQIVRIAPGLVHEFLFEENEDSRPIYLLPRSDGTIVGGTALRGDDDLTVRPTTTEDILRRARELAPQLAEARVLDVLVGLRPGRPTVRLEAERREDTLVIHNYGHGGAGFTLSWGCAEEVAALAAQG